uniref:(northern house mosquito) hypothetical protein n=1 Tax=Culex pipiens TaxID=7175 RepID=A0A8D8C8D2_CULPI
MNVLLIVCLVLVPATFGQSKTGCVTLKHLNYGGYLTSSSKNDDKTRHVAAKEDDPEKWDIQDAGDGTYTIMNKEYDEYLVASSSKMAHNHYVYLWIPGKSGLSGHKWKITKDGKYSIIENVQRPSCLIQGSGTWVYSQQVTRCDVAKIFKWRIESC